MRDLYVIRSLKKEGDKPSFFVTNLLLIDIILHHFTPL